MKLSTAVTRLILCIEIRDAFGSVDLIRDATKDDEIVINLVRQVTEAAGVKHLSELSARARLNFVVRLDALLGRRE